MLDTFELAGEVVAQRAEVAARDERLRDAFACGTARAVSTAPTVAELLVPFIKPGGVAILQRGTMDARERAALADAALVLAAEVTARAPTRRRPPHRSASQNRRDAVCVSPAAPAFQKNARSASCHNERRRCVMLSGACRVILSGACAARAVEGRVVARDGASTTALRASAQHDTVLRLRAFGAPLSMTQRLRSA